MEWKSKSLALPGPNRGIRPPNLPANAKHYQLTLDRFEVIDYGDDGDEIEIAGKIAAVPLMLTPNLMASNVFFNRATDQYIYLSRSSHRLEGNYNLSETIDAYETFYANETVDFYLNGNPKGFEGINIACNLLEIDDFNNDEMDGILMLPVSKLNPGDKTNHEIFLKSTDGEKIMVYFTVERVK